MSRLPSRLPQKGFLQLTIIYTRLANYSFRIMLPSPRTPTPHGNVVSSIRSTAFGGGFLPIIYYLLAYF